MLLAEHRYKFFAIYMVVLVGFFQNASAEAGGKGHRLDTRKVGKAPNQKIIKGSCVLVEGNGNPFTGPCADLQLTLIGEDGKEVIRTRTDVKGTFLFLPDVDGRYGIVPSSDLYENLEKKPYSLGNVANIKILRKKK